VYNIVAHGLPGSVEWLIALVLPILKEFHLWVWTKTVLKTQPCNLDAILQWTTIRLEIFHAFFEATLLQNINDTTMYAMLSIGFLFHLRTCYNIIQKHNKVRDNNVTDEQEQKDMKKDLQGLALSESLEVMVPAIYSISMIIAYYGPNATILGNIRNDYWDYEVLDIKSFLNQEFQMVAIDFGFGVISALILWTCCRINIVQQFCHLLKMYWAIICIQTMMQLSAVNRKPYKKYMIKLNGLFYQC